MKLAKIFFASALLMICLISANSCQTLAKAYFGIKNPKVYGDPEKREKYYEPFYENKPHLVNLYTIADTSTWVPTFEKLHVPRVLLKNNITDTVYVLSCFEDIAYDVELLNAKKYGKVYKADSFEFSKVQDAFKNTAVKSYTVNEGYNKGEWDAYLIYGTFMGKKIRRRTLPITELNGLRSINILDVSVDKEK